jgi:crotonobetainyl-CoA:carnitine CoA-transferase CaiB-like acyl-CoA transferase
MEKLKEVMGVEELEQEAIKEHVKTMTRDEAVKFFSDVGLPVAPVYWASEATKDPHVRARDMFVEVEHPKMGKYEAINFPVKMSESPGKVTSCAPLLGEHNKQVVMDYLGYTEEQYDELKKNGVMAEGV